MRGKEIESRISKTLNTELGRPVAENQLHTMLRLFYENRPELITETSIDDFVRGTIEKGKMANVIVTEGNLLDSPRIRHVFVAGWPVDLDVPVQGLSGRGGRGSERPIPNH